MYSNPVIPFPPIWWRWIAKVSPPPLFLLLCWTLSFSVYITHPGVEGRRCHTFGRCVLCNARNPVNKGRKPFHLISLEIHDADNAPRGTRLTTTTLPIEDYRCELWPLPNWFLYSWWWVNFRLLCKIWKCLSKCTDVSQPTQNEWMNLEKRMPREFVPPTHHNYMQGHFRRLFSPLSRGAAFSRINNLWCIMLLMMMRTGQLVLLWMVRTNECQMSLQSGEEYKKVGLWFNLDILSDTTSHTTCSAFRVMSRGFLFFIIFFACWKPVSKAFLESHRQERLFGQARVCVSTLILIYTIFPFRRIACFWMSQFLLSLSSSKCRKLYKIQMEKTF